MFRCALKKDCLAYIIFNGGSSSNYPEWYREVTEDNIYEDEFRFSVAVNINKIPNDVYVWSDVLIEGYDAFVRNHKGKVTRTDVMLLEEEFVEVADGTIALYEDTLEYLLIERNTTIFPDWYPQLYFNYKDTIDELIDSFGEAVILAKMDEENGDYFIITSLEDFKKEYFFFGHGIEWDKFE